MLDLTSVLRVYARWRTRYSLHSAIDLQERLLLRLVNQSERTCFGADHGFASVKTISDFQRQTPLRSYASFWEDYWRADFPILIDCSWPGLIPNFAKSSGTTTGTSKYIPYTWGMARHAALGMLDLICHHVVACPDSRLLGGTAVVLSGPEELEELAPGVHAGAVSAISAVRSRRWTRDRVLPSSDIARIKDWHEKTRKLAQLACNSSVRALGGSPNWLLLFLDQAFKARPHESERLVEIFPELELVVHGGVNFDPYRSRFRELLKGSHAETREAYSASEGFFAIADQGDGEGLRLLPNAGVFFEFVPLADLNGTDPRRHWIRDIEIGMDYAVAVSTAAGLWAYLLGDTVRFLSRDPPRLVVTGRTSYVLSALGEHVIEEETADAISTAARAIGVDIIDYAVTARVTQEGPPGGRHEYLIDCTPSPSGPETARRFCEALDGRLAELNEDYREHRSGNFSLRPPKVTFTPPGGFVAWLKTHRSLGGQNKVPRVIQDVAFFDEVAAFMVSLNQRNDA